MKTRATSRQGRYQDKGEYRCDTKTRALEGKCKGNTKTKAGKNYRVTNPPFGTKATPQGQEWYKDEGDTESRGTRGQGQRNCDGQGGEEDQRRRDRGISFG